MDDQSADQDPRNQIQQALLTADIELRNLPDFNEVVDSAIAAARSAINAASATFGKDAPL